MWAAPPVNHADTPSHLGKYSNFTTAQTSEKKEKYTHSVAMAEWPAGDVLIFIRICSKFGQLKWIVAVSDALFHLPYRRCELRHRSDLKGAKQKSTKKTQARGSLVWLDLPFWSLISSPTAQAAAGEPSLTLNTHTHTHTRTHSHERQAVCNYSGSRIPVISEEALLRVCICACVVCWQARSGWASPQ